MYHHFCDFFNLYASLHVNASHPSTFDTDNHILIWESYNYQSAFQDTFEAFTSNPLWDLKTFRGDTVCFKNIIFPMLPRMIFGLYYNTPLVKRIFLFRNEPIIHHVVCSCRFTDVKKVGFSKLSAIMFSTGSIFQYIVKMTL